MPFRKILFWVHLTAGCLAGLVIFLMAVTGVLLTYEKQLTLWADFRGLPEISADSGRNPLSPEDLLAAFVSGGKAIPSAVTLRRDPGAAVALATGPVPVYVNPYTGEIVGEGCKSIRAFFRAVTDLHRWIAMKDASRPTGKAITGAANLFFLFLVISGFYIWWPKQWNRQTFRPIAWFRSGLSGKARDFNWHNAIGFWCCVPLFFMVLGATVISYPWASNLVYRLTGNSPPAPAPNAAKGELSYAGLNRAFASAASQSRGWRTITLRIPTGPASPVTAVIDAGYPGQPQYRTTLTLQRESGEIEKKETFSELDSGRRLRFWLRFVHTGEYYGLAGQTVAGIASLGAAFLAYTGVALSLRRFFGWRARRDRGVAASV